MMANRDGVGAAEVSRGGRTSADPKERRGGFLLSRVSRAMAKRFASLMKEEGLEEIGSGEGRLVYLLWKDGPLRQGELAERARIDKSTLALTLARMGRKGLVSRARAGDDARAVIVALGKDAAAHGEAYRRVSEKMGEVFYRGIGEPDIDAFERTLARILENVEEKEM